MTQAHVYLSRIVLAAIKTWICSRIRTFVLDLMLYARLTAPSKTIGADHLEVFRNVIHLLFFKVCDDDIYFITSSIMHTAQEHKFGKLNTTI